MIKKLFFILLIIVLIGAVGGIIYHKILLADNISIQEETKLQNALGSKAIIEIPVDSVDGITPEESEELCYFVMGEADEETGFPFSFGVAGAIEQGEKEYYVIRASWLVNNSHMSYIGDFFVAADGMELYSGTAKPGEYTIENLIWNK